MRNRRLLRTMAAISAAATLAFIPSVGSAATATADLTVSATVTNNCTISTAAVSFGSYDPVVANASTSLDGTGAVTVACTKGATATIALGTGGSSSGSNRRLSDGTGNNYLNYELYRDSGRSIVWGTTGTNLLSPAAAESKAPREFPVYGRVTNNQDIPAGSYSDTVVATVNF